MRSSAESRRARLAGILWDTTALLTLAWGAFAFGAVYEWAFRPLLALCALLGLTAFIPWRGGGVPRRLVFGIAAVMIATALQLVPVPPRLLDALSPAADAFLRAYELRYAAQASIAEAMRPGHPLSIDPARTRLGLEFLAALSLFLIGTVRRLSQRPPYRLAAGIVALGALLAVVGIIEQPTYNGLVLGFWKPDFEGTAPFGPFINRNHFAGWMLMAIPLALGQLCGLLAVHRNELSGTWRTRILWLSSPAASRILLLALATLVMSLSLMLTTSRSGVSAFLISLALVGAIAARRQGSSTQRVLTGAAFMALAIVTAAWAGFDAVAGKFAAADTLGISGRLPIWADTLSVIRRFWLIGTGLNTYGPSMVLYQVHNRNVHFNEAHNDLLQLAAEGGILLAVPILLTVGLFVREVRTRFGQNLDDPRLYWLRAGAVVGLVAIAVQELVEFSLQMPGNAALFCVVAAVAVHQPARSWIRRSRSFVAGHRATRLRDADTVTV